jgi:alkylation response protein AidB-like acyl-CoA dehydrogenase
MTATSEKTELEPVEDFRRRAREWFAGNMRRLEDVPPMEARSEDHWQHLRALQKRIWDGGFAGVCWPAEYGGLGLTQAHQRAFNEESLPYEMPTPLNVPTFGILAATLIEFGTHEQKARHLPAILKGEELWVQFLSEPTGGSDLAGCITRADRDGDVFIMNGSKIWSSSAAVSDYAMCLARTNWDVPKHRGLTMFIMKIHQPGVQIEPIRQVNGSMEFCQEFFDDVAIPVTDVVGEIDDGWNVASRLLVHERMAVGGASPYTSGRAMAGESSGGDPHLVRLVRELGLENDATARQSAAGFHVEELVHHHLQARVTRAMALGEMPPPSGSLLKLSHAILEISRAQAAVEIAGEDIAVGGGLARRLGDASLGRQGISLGGGSNEIQRNIISERLLGMPREWAADREVAYKDVKRNTMPTGPK